MKSLILFLFALLLAACSSGPKNRVDEDLVAKLSAEAQKAVTDVGQRRADAESKWQNARQELNKVEQVHQASRKELDLAAAKFSAATAKEELDEARVKLHQQLVETADRNRRFSAVTYEYEKAKAVQAGGVKSAEELGLLNFEQEFLEAQKAFTEANLKAVDTQKQVAELEENLTEKLDQVRKKQ